MKKDIQFAEVIRFLGVILILLCHYTEQSTNVLLNMSAQFLNIGVPIFIILSGFLFGVREGGKNALSWYMRRIKRIYIPYELFVIILAVITILYGGNIIKRDWLFLVLGLQGSVVGVYGAEQTWFITALLFCYMLTPVIRFIVLEICKSRKKLYIIYTTVFLIIPIFLSFIPPAFVYTLFIPFCWYALAYLIGYKFTDINLTSIRAICSFGIMILIFGVRILMRMGFDGSYLYDRITVSYTQAIAAFCIFYIIAYIFKNRKANQIVLWISSISFEMYLYHYMFTVGPIKLFGISGNWIIDCIVVTIVVVIISMIMSRWSALIIRKLNVRYLCKVEVRK